MKINNGDLRNNKYTYDIEILEQNVINLSMKILVNTQTLTSDFCVKYILNEEYMDCGEEIDLLTDSYVLSRQPHITRKELDDSYEKYKNKNIYPIS